MSSRGQRIVCRNCKETIDLDVGSCPHCGTPIRNNTPYIAGIVVGAAMVVATIFEPGDLLAFGALGLALGGSAAFVLYDKRQRIQRASEETQVVTDEAA